MDNSRSAMVKCLLMKAWRERWNDSQWGINIKTVLPRGVSGDVYNLSDCILQQAVIGTNASQLALSYLKHSLCARLISHAAVLKCVSKFTDLNKVHCVIALLEFLDTIIGGVTCRTKSEEGLLPKAIISIILWLMKIMNNIMEKQEPNGFLIKEETIMLNKISAIFEEICKNDFLIAIFYIGKQENLDYFDEIRDQHSHIKKLIKINNFNMSAFNMEKNINKLSHISVNDLEMLAVDTKKPESITYCIQPLLSIIITLNPTSETQTYVSHLLMIKRLKYFSKLRLYFEICRAGLISLSNTDETHDSIWSAFTFIKIPNVLKRIHLLTTPKEENLDYIPEVIEALDKILNDSVLLSVIDAKCEENFIELMLEEWKKLRIVNDSDKKSFAAKREDIRKNVPVLTPSMQAQSVIKYITKIELPLDGLLRTLSADYNRVQESLYGVLCQVLQGNSFDFILSFASVDERLKTFVSRLIKCNENSKQLLDVSADSSLVVRSPLFDVSFIMLTFIILTYGSDILLPEKGDTFFERWVRECLVEKNKMKSPKHMVALCDEKIVDELLLTLSKPDGQLKNSNITYQDICMNIPGVLYQVLVAWENETLSTAEIFRILDSIKRRPYSYSICAASFLCAYVQTVREDEFLKPMNMLREFLNPHAADELATQHDEYIKERFSLTYKIIKKFQNDIPPANTKYSMQNLAVNPLDDQFHEAWRKIIRLGWLPIKSTNVLESLLQSCGSIWIVGRLLEQLLATKYIGDMNKISDIIFAILHLDIERNTEALLEHLITILLENNKVDSHSIVLARLGVYCIISNFETLIPPVHGIKKRSRTDDHTDDHSSEHSTKMRKLNSDGVSDSCGNEYGGDHKKHEPIKEPLLSSLKALFRTFAQFVNNDELSPRIYFVFEFISLLIECSSDIIKPLVLNLIPQNLVRNLIKVMTTGEIKVGFICRLYDLKTSIGRQSAISDLCLLRNIRMRTQTITL